VVFRNYSPISSKSILDSVDIDYAFVIRDSTGSKMTFPDVVQGLSDRNTIKQCLVESLGNRECLVYRGDEEKLLYVVLSVPQGLIHD
jgi:hypothetical protein